MLRQLYNKTWCTICGGARGFIRFNLPYPAHLNCTNRVPTNYVLWFLGEKEKYAQIIRR